MWATGLNETRDAFCPFTDTLLCSHHELKVCETTASSVQQSVIFDHESEQHLLEQTPYSISGTVEGQVQAILNPGG